MWLRRSDEEDELIGRVSCGATPLLIVASCDIKEACTGMQQVLESSVLAETCFTKKQQERCSCGKQKGMIYNIVSRSGGRFHMLHGNGRGHFRRRTCIWVEEDQHKAQTPQEGCPVEVVGKVTDPVAWRLQLLRSAA